MKNKHLVILFLAVLAVGLLTRGLPWRANSLFQTTLLRMGTAEVTQISIWSSTNPELLIEKTDNGWVASQRNRTILAPEALVREMLSAISGTESIQIIKPCVPDTTGLSSADTIGLKIFANNRLLDFLKIGRVMNTSSGPATFVRIDAHTGDYLVKGDLKRIFNKNIDDFRRRTVLDFPFDQIKSLSWQFPKLAPIRFEKQDSLQFWQHFWQPGLTLSADSVAHWFLLLKRLNESQFADHFDDTRNAQTNVVNLTLSDGSQQVLLEFFHLQRPDLPDDPTEYPSKQPLLATYFVKSSQNPTNYFAITDSTLARQICRTFYRPAAADSISAKR
ncbi:MAG: hypothetical protein WCR52_13425 [Bacteroidota bacterium]